MGTNTPQLLKWPAPVAQRYDEMVTSTAYLVEITWTERIQRKQWGWGERSAMWCITWINVSVTAAIISVTSLNNHQGANDCGQGARWDTKEKSSRDIVSCSTNKFFFILSHYTFFTIVFDNEQQRFWKPVRDPALNRSDRFWPNLNKQVNLFSILITFFY